MEFCKVPFKEAVVDPFGEVFLCCPPNINNYSVGNILEQPFDEIWNGEKARNFRKTIIDNSYKFCNVESCSFDAPRYTEAESLTEVAPYPKFVSLCIDCTCNLKCIMCREGPLRNNIEPEKIRSLIDKTFIPMLSNAGNLALLGTGEIFVSEICQELAAKACKKYPELKLVLWTNGVFCNEKNIEKLGGFDKIKQIRVSFHAATEQTYDKIMVGGDYNQVLSNLKWLSDLKKQNKIKTEIELVFVVFSLNYKEMKEFLQLCIELDFNAVFWEVQNRNDYSLVCNNFEEYNVFDESHREYDDFVKTLQDPIFDSEKCLMNDLLKNIREKGAPKGGIINSLKKLLKFK